MLPSPKEDIVIRMRKTRENMIGTDDEDHYWDCKDAADEIERLRHFLSFHERGKQPPAGAAT